MDKFRQNRQKKKQSKQHITHSLQQIGEEGPITPLRLNQSRLMRASLNEQAQQKLRQMQMAHQHLQDVYDKLVSEKKFVQDSLNQQIQKYKNLIKQIEVKAQNRLREVQKVLKDEMDRKVKQKQAEIKIMQDQNRQLRDSVDQLQQIGNKLQLDLNCTKNDLKNTQQNLKKTQQQKKIYMEKLEVSEQQTKAQAVKFQGIVDDLKQKAIAIQRQWRDKLDDSYRQKQKQLKNLQKLNKQQIRRIQQKFEAQKNQRKQQMKELLDSFQAQKQRLNQLVAEKQRSIQKLHRQSIQGIEKLNSVIRGYQQEIQSLASQKARLFEEVDSLNSQNTHLDVLVKQLQLNAANEKKNLQAYIIKLKDDINYSQVNFLRERDRNVVHYQDSTKQIVILKKQLSALQAQYQRLKYESGDSAALAKQVRQLSELLMQSSYQLEKCKSQFVRMSKQRDFLALKANQNVFQAVTLRRTKHQPFRQQRRAWGEPMPFNRSRSIRR